MVKTPGFTLVIILCLTTGSSLAQEQIPASVITEIKREALQGSQVMEYVFYLSDVYGARLTGSPAFKAAGDWVVNRLNEFGLKQVRREPIG